MRLVPTKKIRNAILQSTSKWLSRHAYGSELCYTCKLFIHARPARTSLRSFRPCCSAVLSQPPPALDSPLALHRGSPRDAIPTFQPLSAPASAHRSTLSAVPTRFLTCSTSPSPGGGHGGDSHLYCTLADISCSCPTSWPVASHIHDDKKPFGLGVSRVY